VRDSLAKDLPPKPPLPDPTSPVGAGESVVEGEGFVMEKTFFKEVLP